jgi:hypothetical protein
LVLGLKDFEALAKIGVSQCIHLLALSWDKPKVKAKACWVGLFFS